MLDASDTRLCPSSAATSSAFHDMTVFVLWMTCDVSTGSCLCGNVVLPATYMFSQLRARGHALLLEHGREVDHGVAPARGAKEGVTVLQVYLLVREPLPKLVVHTRGQQGLVTLVQPDHAVAVFQRLEYRTFPDFAVRACDRDR